MDIEKDYSGQTIGKYELIEKLGKGHFGAVYSANDLVLKSSKAIKIMNVSNAEQAYKLFEEASIPYKCAHNNIVQINGGSLEPFENEMHFVIDMELVDSGSIEDAIKGQTLSLLDSTIIIKDVLFGLQHSHNQGIVHRDIKPANILLSNGVPKLSDFGLATTLNTLLPGNEPWYMTHAAPEIKNTLTPTVETDIFAVGMTMFRAVNGISNWMTYLNSIRNINTIVENGTLAEKAPYKPFVPSKLRRIIKKACKPNPDDRYHSASEMRDAIEHLTPYLSWREKGQFEWQGTTNNQVQSIITNRRRNGFEVAVKINGRKNSANSKQFTSQNDAEKYMYQYICGTTFK